MFKKIAVAVVLACVSTYGSAAITDIASTPLQATTVAKPNIIFSLDDSGSMDFETMLKTSDGALWWNNADQSVVDAQGKPLFNPNGIGGNFGGVKWYKYAYLFPNGTGTGARNYYDYTYDTFAVPPTPAFAFMRCSSYNTLYYNPSVTYLPWKSAYYSGSTRTFSNSSALWAYSHPLFSTILSSGNMILTADQFSTGSERTFWMFGGMVIPGSATTLKRQNGVGGWSANSTDYTVGANEKWEVAMSYFPATYYVPDATCTSGASCATAPDGVALRRYEIKPGNTFPSGRTYTDELQNFANWFTYYRKRKLMLSAAMGQVLSPMKSMRAGLVRINGLSPVTMYDFDAASDASNAKALLGQVYSNPAINGTPTRQSLLYVGNQFETNASVVQYGCQLNAAFVLSDGFANAATVSVPTYSQATYGTGLPYQTIYNSSLADIALAYFTRNIRSDLITGVAPTNLVSDNPDTNSNPHMNTYALTLGALGTIFGTNSASATAPFANPPTWPQPNIDYHPSAVDDLWHATINGRGMMLSSLAIQDTITSFTSLIQNVILRSGTAATIEFTSVFLQPSSNIAFLSSYASGFGNLDAVPVSTTGVVNTNAPIWSARDLLDDMSPNNRVIATHDGTSAIAFRANTVTPAVTTLLQQTLTPYITYLNSLLGAGSYTQPTTSDYVNWIRGDRSLENTTLRVRAHLLGSIVSAQPVYVTPPKSAFIDSGYSAFKSSKASRAAMVYQGANDGMLHAFSAATGAEKWAYIPYGVLANIAQTAARNYTHLFLVDSTPVVSDMSIGGSWKTVLVGGLGAGGSGYYALDITDGDTISSESTLATKVLWEFPNASTAAGIKNNIGLTFGQPILAKTRANGWVVIVSSGYNNTAGDGKGHLFVLNATDGTVIRDLVTTAGTATTPSGLAHIAGFAKNVVNDPIADYVYGGDTLGNVWRFDLSSTNSADWNVKLLATLVDGSGNPQPITTTPELAQHEQGILVFVGTGRLLGVSDLTSTSTQSFYGLLDNLTTNPTITPLRTSLAKRTVSGTQLVVNQALDYATSRGWYFDLPLAGERVSSDPIIAFGLVIFNSNFPSSTVCLSQSYQYIVNLKDGTQLPASRFQNESAWARKLIGNTLTTRARVIALSNGTINTVSHNADTTVTNNVLIGAPTRTVNKTAWRELLRQ